MPNNSNEAENPTNNNEWIKSLVSLGSMELGWVTRLVLFSKHFYNPFMITSICSTNSISSSRSGSPTQDARADDDSTGDNVKRLR